MHNEWASLIYEAQRGLADRVSALMRWITNQQLGTFLQI